MPIEIKTPCGRVVWGNPGKSQVKLDMTTKKPKLNKDGQPVNQWAFGIAIPKGEFQQHVWPAMAQEAAAGYPQGTPPKFAWKYQDGDGVDSNGQPFNKREGYAGCYVLTVSSEAFAPPIYKFQNGAYVQLTGDQIKTGDYVVVAIKFQVNVPQDRTFTPGLYVNPVAIEHIGYGTEIQNGPDPMALFGGQQRQLPQGASATPIAPSHGVGMPGTNGGMPGPSGMPGQMPQGQPGGYQQPGPGNYAPPVDPRFTGGGPGNNSGMPGNPPPMHQPQQQPGYQQPQPGQQQHVMPAHDFVHNAGHQQPQGMPQQQYQQPGPAPQYQQQQQQPQQQYQQPAPGNYAPPPNGMPNGQMPGMPPNR